MVVFGLLVVAAVAGVTVDAYFQNEHQEQVVLFGVHISNASPGRVFVAGMIAMLVLVIGVLLTVRGLKRSRRRRVAQRAEVAERESTAAAAAAQRDQLTDQLAREREARLAEVDAAAPPTRLRDGRPDPTPSGLPTADQAIVLPASTSRRGSRR